MITEDGTGLALAESYASLDDVTTYQIGRTDYDAWINMSVEQQEAAVREATTYLDGTFTWRGAIQYQTQALSWPRVGAIDDEGRLILSNTVPLDVVHACAFLAAKSISTSLQPEQSGAAITSKSVGPAGVSISYGSAGASVTTKREFPEVKTMLRGLYVGSPGGTSGTLVRWS
jgi:hypothetical protein